MPGSPDLLLPVDVASFSRTELRETTYHFSGNYALGKDFSGRLDYKYKDFEDVLDNIHDGEEDGDGHILLLTLSKKWG
jgi:hypothetical protein